MLTTKLALRNIKAAPAFQAEGTVTAGNASGINDGAAFLCLVSQEIVDRYQLTPLAEVLGFGQAG